MCTIGSLTWDTLYFSTDWHRSWNSQLMMDRCFSTREYYGLQIWDKKNPAFMKDPRHRIKLPENDWMIVPASSQDKHDHMGRHFAKDKFKSVSKKLKV